MGPGANEAMTPLYDEVLVSVIKSQATLIPSIAGTHRWSEDLPMGNIGNA